MVAISDDFNRANAGTLGANWTDYAIGAALSIVSNTCRAVSAAGNNAASRHNTAMAVPHWAKSTVTVDVSADGLGGPCVRCDTGAITFYFGGIYLVGGVVTARIDKITAGSLANLVTVSYGSLTGTVTLYATGTTTTVLTLAIDGVQVAQVSDSTSPFSTQLRGGVLNAADSVVVITEDFAAQDVATVPLAPTALVATPSATQTITLAWTAPFDGMAAITDYVIEYSTDNTNWSTFADGTSTAVTATVTGLSNGTLYYFRVSATNSTGTGTTSLTATALASLVPGFIGVGAFAVDTVTSNAVTAAYPAGYSAVAQDISILAMQGKHNNGTTLAPTAPSGYTQVATRFHEVGAYDIQITADIDRFAGGEAAAAPLVPAAYSTSSGGLSAYQAIFRNVDGITAEDAAAVVSSGAAAATFVPTGIAVTRENVLVVSMAVTADDNALALLAGSEQGFTLIAGGPTDASAYDTTTGGDHAMCMAYRLGAQVALISQAAAPSQLTDVDNTAGTAYNYRWDGTGVDIIVPGAGVRGTHDEFDTSRCATGWAHPSVGGNGNVDTQGHDTATSSCAAGNICGVAKGARIVPYRIVTAGTETEPISVARMLTALDQIRTDYKGGTPAVLFYSMLGYEVGDTDSDAHTVDSTDITNLTAAFVALADIGIPIVTAAGNNAGTYNKVPQTISSTDLRFTNVGNVNAATLVKDPTSSFGSLINIWAVASGTGVQHAGIGSDAEISSDEGLHNGTSNAAPIVAGTYAKLKQAHPSYTAQQLRAIVVGNATRTGNVGAGSPTKLVNTLFMPAGAVGTSVCPTWSETLVGNDAWAAITMALRPVTFRPLTFVVNRARITAGVW